MTLATVPASDVVVDRPANPVSAYMASVARGSRATVAHSLASALAALRSESPPPGIEAKLRYVAPFPWHTLRHEHVAFIRSELSERAAARSVNRCLAAVRGVLRSAWRCGLLSHEEMSRAVDVPSVRVQTLPAGRHVNRGELHALFAACADDSTPAGARDAAILACCYGMRRAEVAGIERCDVDLESGKIRVTGKGNKTREFFVANGGLAALRAWATIRGDDPGPFFHPCLRGGRLIRERGLTSQSIYAAVEKRRQQAGVAEFSCHSLRRTFCGDALDAGMDLVALQRLAGHAQISTTAMYDRRQERACRDGAALLALPYVQR